MLYRLLNGDLIDLGDEVKDPRATLGDYLQVDPFLIELIPDAEHEEYTLAIVQSSHSVRVPFQLLKNMTRLERCVNTDMLAPFVRGIERRPRLWRNPHPSVVQAILSSPKRFDPVYHEHMCLNPHPEVVDFLLEKPNKRVRQHMQQFIHNSNPRAVHYVVHFLLLPENREDWLSLRIPFEHLLEPHHIQRVWNRFAEEKGYLELLPPNDHPYAVELRLAAIAQGRLHPRCRGVLMSADPTLLSIGLASMDNEGKYGGMENEKFASRPLDLLADWILSKSEPEHAVWKTYGWQISMNPHPRIVEYLLHHPSHLEPNRHYFVCNPHPLAIAYNKEFLAGSVDPNKNSAWLASLNPNEELYLWMHRRGWGNDAWLLDLASQHDSIRVYTDRTLNDSSTSPSSTSPAEE